MPRFHFHSIAAWLREIFADPFKKILIIILFLLGLAVYTVEQVKTQSTVFEVKEVSFFFHPQCPHCQKQKKFNTYLKAKYPQLKWAEYDTSVEKNARLLATMVEKNHSMMGVPRTYIGPYEVFGFKSEETTGVTLEKAIQAYVQNDPSLFEKSDLEWQKLQVLEVPILGTIDYSDYSLLPLAVILGLVDGFNPCAMWVLVYLISLILTLQDQKKIWFLVGTFVAASGGLYFLFMTAWLNAFLFLGYVRILTLIIGLIAIGAGILNIREYFRTRGELVCTIGDSESKQKTMSRIERIVHSPLTLFSIFSIILLAFVVNSIEFVCSAALPAIFTHTLALSNLSTLQHYGYILIYDLFFMLDDLIIFTLAVLALNTGIAGRYAKYCKIIGGGILLILGGIMVFHPQMLR